MQRLLELHDIQLTDASMLVADWRCRAEGFIARVCRSRSQIYSVVRAEVFIAWFSARCVTPATQAIQ